MTNPDAPDVEIKKTLTVAILRGQVIKRNLCVDGPKLNKLRKAELVQLLEDNDGKFLRSDPKVLVLLL